MSTTLTNGLKLPDKGSVDWYADMQNNYQILDGAVGTVAEHTTALAGKAPAVHTHTKADITDFPAYGTTAGTICEGNDSRLSDARTPVAHTHLTSDVTDLLNTSHEWSKSQTYSDASAIIIKNNNVEIGNEPLAYNEQIIRFNDKNNKQITAIKYENRLSSDNTFANGLEFVIADKFKEGVRDPTGTTVTNVFRMGLWNDGTKYIYNEGRWRTSLIPFANNAVDVGSSSNQWNNLYAKNYYYNGTAWGLDKANTWTGSQTLSSNSFLTVRGYRFRIKNDSMILGTAPSSNQWTGMQFVDKNDNSISEIVQSFQSNGNSLYQINVYPNEANSEKRSVISYTYSSTNNINNVSFSSNVTPQNSNTYGLGTSTNKWKTLNGLNPGALSIPDGADSGANSSFTPDTTDWPKDGTAFQATMPIVGWLRITIKNVTGNYAFVRRGTAGANQPWQIFADPSFAADFTELTLNVPVTNGTYTLKINSSGGFTAKVYPCLGNV